jgi:hypothetical protein
LVAGRRRNTALWRVCLITKSAAARRGPRSVAVNLPRRSIDQSNILHFGPILMKIALLALLGLLLGAVGGAALGIGAGLAWVELFKTTDFEGYSGMLVFFTFMPAGAMIGGLGGAATFGLIAARDDEIVMESESSMRRDHR